MTEEQYPKLLFDLFPANWLADYKVVGIRFFSTNLPDNESSHEFIRSHFFPLWDQLCPRDSMVLFAKSVSLPDLPNSQQDIFYDDGLLRFHITSGESIVIRGNSIIVSAPIIDGDEINLNLACDICRSILTLIGGAGAACIFKKSIHFLTTTRQFSIQGQIVENYLSFEYSKVQLQSISIAIDQKDRIRKALKILSRSIGEVDTNVKFMLFWVALECVCGGSKGRKKFFDDFCRVNIWAQSSLTAIRKKRNDLFHEGIDASLSQDEEIFLHVIILSAIRWAGSGEVESHDSLACFAVT